MDKDKKEKAKGAKSAVQLKESEYWLRCDENGNVVDKEVKRVDVMIKEIPRVGFAITYLTSVISMIDSIGNKKMQVVKYLLKNMDSNNKLSETVREIAKGSECSLKTVNDTLKILEDANIIARKTGTVMLSPKLMHKGNAQKEKILMTKFVEVGREGNAEKRVAEIKTDGEPTLLLEES